jgi:hypothetical protein
LGPRLLLFYACWNADTVVVWIRPIEPEKGSFYVKLNREQTQDFLSRYRQATWPHDGAYPSIGPRMAVHLLDRHEQWIYRIVTRRAVQKTSQNELDDLLEWVKQHGEIVDGGILPAVNPYPPMLERVYY